MKSGPSYLLSIDKLTSTPFSDIIDVRSPAEFADDHIPGAISCPVLSNDERAEIGTIYKQVSPFEAKKRGAALVARNIARHLEERFLDRPRDWRPLVYCWRGGQRSGAMVTIFRQIGWHACQLEGGYKAYRQQVVAELGELPRRFDFRVVCGATGSGKSRILQEIGRLGGQIVDLEALACHKGSVLGVLPGQPQPSQKMFESQLLQALRGLDAARPVYVEAESRKIGRLQVPEAMIETMRAGQCVGIEAPRAARVAFLLRDYDYFLNDPAWLNSRLAALKDLRGGETVARWQDYANAGRWPELVEELLADHYDPLYERSQNRNYSGYGEPRTVAAPDLSPAGIAAVARQILAA
ncbi:tRNA 2-selenouridine(34) synthase MnmH [Azospira restricta]|uniref:tRNA 2-selenouridine(34) synthase MnmH n=1 Tax=Azospira restricta TaxID=404405 RepID=A0A974SNI1_9RHOO|nr:tRNA 2-selenouridine(34) synthase MnmH [Azospira restricta]QRJ62933.1 tRNA 2-selenouridine(34) synthase MnmH [Azospira restricta]